MSGLFDAATAEVAVPAEQAFDYLADGIRQGEWTLGCSDREPVTSSPRRRTRPSRGRSSPIIARISVDLPAPFGPTIVTISPGSILTSTPRRMSTSGT